MTRHSISACLFLCALACATMTPPARGAETPDALARELGDSSFETREAAHRSLVKLGSRALPALRKAAESPDPEIRRRAQSAIRMIRWNVTPELARKIGDVFAGYESRKWFERERLVMDVAAVGGRGALPCLERVLKTEKSRPARRAAAMGLLRLGADGLLALERAGGKLLDLPRDDPALRIEIGNAFLEEGRYQRAADEYRKGLKLAPKNATLWYNLACACSRLKKHEAAAKALRKALECGFNDIDWLKRDPDLESLRRNKLYKKLLDHIESKRAGD